MTRFLTTWLLALFVLTRAAFAQDIVFIQIEAQPSLNLATQRARDYAAGLDDVNGFSLGAGWYGIALGPYAREDAVTYMRQLRGSGLIPRDSYIASPSEYADQYFPEGVSILQDAPADIPETTPTPEPEAPAANEPDAAPDAPVIAPAPAPEPEPQPEPEETLREARQSESRLSRAEKMDLQVALKWAGFYTAAIDGAYGPGTRRSMAAWQAENGVEPTGVLTTRQRARLLAQYNAVLDGMDMREVADVRAGIAMTLPMGVVAFDKYESPFAHYAATNDLGARVLLISEPGDQTTLYGLYEILQTLEIVPVDGPRERGRSSFTLQGENSRIVSYTEAKLVGGAIKGFTLIWPAGDEERRTRVLDLMKDSFRTTDAVLDPAVVSDSGQTVDLVSGLRVRVPLRSRTGFYVDGNGTVVTALEAVDGCARVTLDEQYEANVADRDPALGIAVLRPEATLVPMSVARLSTRSQRIGSEIAVAGYSYEGALGAPSVTFGTLSDLRGLAGETDLRRLALPALDGDIGGPVFDGTGAVMGILLPHELNGRVLPDDVSFALGADALSTALSQSGIRLQAARGTSAMAPEDLAKRAAEMTVLVSCWD